MTTIPEYLTENIVKNLSCENPVEYGTLILKKCGEECSEVIIAAKNGKNEDTANEICDLIYHLLVMMVESGIPLEDVEKILAERRQKIGNLKKFHVSDHNT